MTFQQQRLLSNQRLDVVEMPGPPFGLQANDEAAGRKRQSIDRSCLSILQGFDNLGVFAHAAVNPR